MDHHSIAPIGNQICVPHALLLISNALRQIPSRANPFVVDELWQYFHAHRLTFKSCFLLYLPQGLLVTDEHVLLSDGEKEAIDAFQSGLIHDRLPPSQAWLRSGFVNLREFLDAEVAKRVSMEGFLPSQISEFDESMPCQHEREVGDEIVDEVDIGPTQLFTPLLRGLLKTGELELDFWFAATLDFGCLIGVWEGYEMDLSNQLPSGYAVVLVPCDSRASVASPSVLVRVMHQQVTLFPAKQLDFDLAQEQGWTHLFDVFGKIRDCNCDASQILLPDTSVMCPSLSVSFTAIALAAFEQSQISSSWNGPGHSLDIQITGPRPAVDALVDFFHEALLPTTCHCLGIKIVVEFVTCGCILRLVGSTVHCPLPSTALRVFVAAVLF